MSAAVDVPKCPLNDGLQIPKLGLGTYLGFDEHGVMEPKNDELTKIVENAIDLGYRLFDTALVYKSEVELGRGIRNKIKDGSVKRDDIFVSSKLWNTQHSPDQVEAAVRGSLSMLGLYYVDLYLMHWPMALNENYTHSDVDYLETWKAMENLQKNGLIKSIGVSNFNKDQLVRLLKEADIKPAVLQIEVHPYLIQKDLLQFCQENGIVVMAYSPFGPLVSRFGLEGPQLKMDDPTLSGIAKKYGKTTPQIILRWLIDRGTVPIPKSTNPKRLAENIDVFDFKLEEEEIEKINAFDAHRRYTLPSFWQTHKYYPFEKIDNPIPDPFVQN